MQIKKYIINSKKKKINKSKTNDPLKVSLAEIAAFYFLA